MTGDRPYARAGEEAGGLWRLRNWRLRTKLLVVLLIPTLTVLALIGVQVKGDLDHATQLAELSAHATVDDTVSEVVHQLQRERDLTVRFVADDRKADPGELRGQRERVDAAIGTFDRELAVNESRLSPQGLDGLRQTKARFGVLSGLRFAGEHSAFPPEAVRRSYSELISGLLDLSDQTVTDIKDPELARLRLASNALARVKDQLSVKRAVLAEALEIGRLSGDRLRALLGAEAELSAARNDFRKFASPEQQRMYDDTVIGLIVDIGNELVESALTRAEKGTDLAGLDPAKWDTSATYTVNLARQVQTAMQEQTRERTDSLAEQARASAISDAGLVFGVLLVGAVLAVIIARSLLRPLRVLRRSALEAAEHRLPEAVSDILADPGGPRSPRDGARRGVAPVPVFSREELGQVARAFDAVHGEAVRLAGEQALLRENVNSMFVNLSRRSQDLVERQLSVLDRMEADEQDSDTLGGLFELDHLATRMRRNSENLLVLSGTDLGREVSGPVAADEIIGAALSEVEHYQRIELAATPELTVRGDTGSDLVHVISELLENATLYSAPESVVTLASAITPAGWEVRITDRGAGMPQTEIDRANARLAEPPEVDVEVSRRMGLYVVSRLSRRHRVHVRLSAAAEGGLTATVLVPPELITLPETPAVPPAPVAVVPSQATPPPPPVEVTPPPPEEPPSLPVFAEPLNPPRRAPVVADEPAPAWPTEDEPNPLDWDAPTERMPAYAAVLSQWFQAVEDGTADGPVPPPRADGGTLALDGWQRPGDPPWPGQNDLEVAIQEQEAGHTEAGLPRRVPKARLAPGLETVPEPEPERVPFTGGRAGLTREPEAVRGRMSSLQNGVRRGRHARAEENYELGETER
ncbi:sensor histidine kinase [Amycolatopsis nigrescens]|uniref:sensor histidine kinase n=1 Tax=Amycolatopsis nigrescens TaxID=381445 RepID=UPI00037E089F|nr:nitrate- and nitrite sensing domain-containing protein [Amycolatopsis nigrescens]